jgi:hypothetical protein
MLITLLTVTSLAWLIWGRERLPAKRMRTVTAPVRFRADRA